jgi:phage/plasmid-associated DNA primase
LSVCQSRPPDSCYFQIAGDDGLSARNLFEGNESFEVTFDILICCNDDIQFDVTDQAIKDRTIVILHKARFVPNPDALSDADREPGIVYHKEIPGVGKMLKSKKEYAQVRGEHLCF